MSSILGGGGLGDSLGAIVALPKTMITIAVVGAVVAFVVILGIGGALTYSIAKGGASIPTPIGVLKV